jgi:hypothetical protein
MTRSGLFLVVAGFVAAVGVMGEASAVVCDAPAAPPGAKVEMIAPDMRMNGVQMAVRAVEAPQPVESVLAHYRSLWANLATAKRPGSMEQTHDGWKIISTVDGTCFTAVQVRAKGNGSYALVSVSQKPDPTAPRAAVSSLPALPGSRIVSETGFADGARNAKTVVVTNSSRLNANAEFYTSTLVRQGWIQLANRPVQTALGTNQVMSFKRGLEEINLVLSPAEGGQVTIVANITDRP